MKVALEKGESLEVMLVEDARVVGTLSLELRGSGLSVSSSSSRSASVSSGSSRSEQSNSSSSDSNEGGSGRGRAANGRRKRVISPEARAKMADAQRRRWEKVRAGKGGK